MGGHPPEDYNPEDYKSYCSDISSGRTEIPSPSEVNTTEPSSYEMMAAISDFFKNSIVYSEGTEVQVYSVRQREQRVAEQCGFKRQLLVSQSEH